MLSAEVNQLQYQRTRTSRQELRLTRVLSIKNFSNLINLNAITCFEDILPVNLLSLTAFSNAHFCPPIELLHYVIPSALRILWELFLLLNPSSFPSCNYKMASMLCRIEVQDNGPGSSLGFPYGPMNTLQATRPEDHIAKSYWFQDSI